MPRNMNAKNKVEANRSRSINLEVLPSEADKKRLVLSFGDKGGAEKKARRSNMTRSERKGDSQQPTADAIRFDNTFSAQTNSDKHTCTKVYKLLAVPVQKTQKQTSAQQVELDLGPGFRPESNSGF